MIIAICNNIDELNNNRVFEKQIAEKYPGSLWVSKLREVSNNWDVVTGDIALKAIKAGINPKSIYVIQEMRARDGRELVSQGAVPCILSCFESPLFAWFFYDIYIIKRVKYRNTLFYKGAYKRMCNKTQAFPKRHHLHFPSYQKTDIMKVTPWESRKDIVMVVANKYYNSKSTYKDYTQISLYIKVKIAEVLGRFSVTKREALKLQLHDTRNEVIKYFSQSELHFDLFGRGWGKTDNCDQELEKAIKKLKPEGVEDKLEKISQYKYAICFENMTYEGYITEKIIDCFVAGVIPIYMGAPDIGDYIPKGAFIDFRNFKSMEELERFLLNQTKKDAICMIEAARDFLLYPEGVKNLFCYDDFAEHVFEIIEKEALA